MEKVNLAEKFALIDQHWSPRIAGELNGQHVKIAKIKGEFEWHQHENEDEMFLVVKGQITIKFRDKDVHLAEGEMLVIPRGVEHLPLAEEEAQILMFEPTSTVNTGENKDSQFTVKDLEKA